MSYIINKTDGSQLAVVEDGSVDQVASDLTLIGKNASVYGEMINENFVKLLESFSNTDAPTKPITGQLWYDTVESRLKVYTGTRFKSTAGTIVSPEQPFNMTPGDLWVDTLRKQLFFYDGESTILAGPPFPNQKETGLLVEDIVDKYGVTHTIIKFYIFEHLIGIFSKETIEPGGEIPEWTGTTWSASLTYTKGNRVLYTRPTPDGIGVFEATQIPVPAGTLPTNITYWKEVFIEPGFNMGTDTSIKFRAPVVQADYLLAPDGVTLKTTEDFVSTTEDSVMTGNLTILNNIPLVLGDCNTELKASNQNFEIVSNYANQKFFIRLKTSSGQVPGLYLDPTTKRAGLFTNTPTATLDIDGDVRVKTSITVNELNFSGTGPVRINSSSDLNLEATGFINFSSLANLVRKSKAQLLSYITAPAGSIAYCTNAPGGACPVWFDGTAWRKFTDNSTI